MAKMKTMLHYTLLGVFDRGWFVPGLATTYDSDAFQTWNSLLFLLEDINKLIENRWDLVTGNDCSNNLYNRANLATVCGMCNKKL